LSWAVFLNFVPRLIYKAEAMLPTIMAIARLAEIRPVRLLTLCIAVVALVMWWFPFCVFVLVDDSTNITR